MRSKPVRVTGNNSISGAIDSTTKQIDEFPEEQLSENDQKQLDDKFDDTVNITYSFILLLDRITKTIFENTSDIKKYINDENNIQLESLNISINKLKEDIIGKINLDIIKDQIKCLEILINDLILSPDTKNLLLEIKTITSSSDIKNLLSEIKTSILSSDIKNLILENKDIQNNQLDEINKKIEIFYNEYTSQKNNISNIEKLIFNMTDCLDKQNLIIKNLSDEVKNLRDDKKVEDEYIPPVKEKRKWFKLF